MELFATDGDRLAFLLETDAALNLDFEAHYDEVEGQWEERLKHRYGFWRGFVDDDCGLFDSGFARLQCPGCHEEYLLAFSCKTRDACPSCAAKRSASTAAQLAEDVLDDVGHAQWVCVIPQMLRPCSS